MGSTPVQSVELNRTHRILVGVVVTGAVVIAAIGFAGSYAAVRDLAEKKGFGAFAPFFPIGIDAGIVVLLALDLLLTWIRIPFPLLRQTAWLLTAATIAFNGAAAWPDPLGVGMHAVIPVLFVVAVEAARHAIGRIADITADKHMEGVRLSRWLLAFPSTFRLWRRMKLWELRSYEQVIAMEQDRLVYEARLRARYGRGWRRKAPVEAMMPLRLARYGVPLTETGPAGLAAAGITVPARLTSGTESASGADTPGQAGRALLPGVSDAPGAVHAGGGADAAHGGTAAEARGAHERAAAPSLTKEDAATAPEERPPLRERSAYDDDMAAEYATEYRPAPEYIPAPPPQGTHPGGHPDLDPRWEEPVAVSPTGEYPLPEIPDEPAAPAASGYAYAEDTGRRHPQVTVPVVQGGRQRPLGRSGAPDGGRGAYAPSQQELFVEPEPAPPAPEPEPAPAPAPPVPEPEPDAYGGDEPIGVPDGVPREEMYFEAYRQYIAAHGSRPSARDLSRALHDGFGVTNVDGNLLSEPYLRAYLREFRERYSSEMGISI
ncbi:DUF2637 domain-containing protein [Streptomyces sp. DSM 42041]|uniref:DUF2637 domain-containing protein n=1 Tax=Streptomyces hazeniae TaxID=3075538 RepID=A0ABU2NXK8_9ACTN|nr:DUF2637 domain-containing protein [Streptomyces sp. DSM 42041]MDT0380717.1 DUF2637 domain-containing protein [Streptomyces sp. DSM 42041]